MQKISIVIICKNEAAVLGATLKSFSGLSDDIIIYDNGSIDDTQKIAQQNGATVMEGIWEGFGKTKNKAIAQAKYDWILCNDADEALDEEALNELIAIELTDESTVYSFLFKNYLGEKWMRYGEWGNDKHIRLFNRKRVWWNDAAVHESLIVPKYFKKKLLPGFIIHKTSADITAFENKMKHYAKLSAQKYFRQEKKATHIKMWFSPVFSFFKNYFFKLGFLDGKEGFACARINALYTFLKYKELKNLALRKKQPAEL